jgi:hypothetical protein
MAEENNVEATTEQESPTVEQKQTESVRSESAVKPEQTPEEADEVQSATEEDKNWKQVRERLRELEHENRKLRGQDKSSLDDVKKSEVITPFLTSEEVNALQFEEFKAQQQFPELDFDNQDTYNVVLDNAVAGRYTAELNAYAKAKLSGNVRPLPNPVQIAREVKKEWDAILEKSGKKGSEEADKKAKETLAKKEATLEPEGRSDRGRASSDQVDNLIKRSRQGDNDAIAERLKLSGL